MCGICGIVDYNKKTFVKEEPGNQRRLTFEREDRNERKI